MSRNLLAIIIGTLFIIIFSLLAVWTGPMPTSLTIWFPLIGFLLGCAVIGLIGRFRALRALIVTLFVYIGTMLVLTLIPFQWATVALGPIQLSQVVDGWYAFQQLIFSLIPVLEVFQTVASTAQSLFADTLIQTLIGNLIIFSLFGIIGLFIAGVSAAATHSSSMHVVLAPEEPRVSAAPGIETGFDFEAPSVPAQSSPEIPTPQPVEGSRPKSAAPSAKAIASLRGKASKHLKSSGQNVPTGQSRCPHCHATIIPGSTFCNACQREFSS